MLGGLPDRAAVTTAAERAGRIPVLAEASVRDLDTAAGLLLAGARGLLLRTTGGGVPAETAALLLGTDVAARFPDAIPPGETTLRNALGLPPPADLLAAAPAAFPAPTATVYR